VSTKIGEAMVRAAIARFVESATLPERYPGAFDACGRPLEAPPFPCAFVVFAQRPAAGGLRMGDLDAAAERNLDARLGAMEARREHEPPTRPFDGATVAIKRGDLQGFRALLLRAAAPEDRARVADALASGRAGGGLDLLARRCDAVFLVAATGDDDPLARIVAEACARAHLGPVLTPSGALVGPKTLAAGD
jgi:hypothetical protein